VRDSLLKGRLGRREVNGTCQNKDLARTLATTQPTDQQRPPANKGKLASIHMSETSDLKPYVLMCSFSFRPAYEEVRQIETRVAFDTQAQTDRSLISAGLIENFIKYR
jgi:hypothetical protein